MQGKYEEAKPLYEKALAIYEEELGPHHPMIVQCLNNTAALYQKLGNYGKAEELYQRAVDIVKQNYYEPEEEELDESTIMKNLADLYEQQGKHNEAKQLRKSATAKGLEVIGKTYHDVGAIPAAYLEHVKNGGDPKAFVENLSYEEQVALVEMVNALKERIRELLQAIESLEAGDTSQERKINIILADLEQKGWVERIPSKENDTTSNRWSSLTASLLPLVQGRAEETEEQDYSDRDAIIQEFESLLEAIAAVAMGDTIQRNEIEAELAQLEVEGWHLREVVQRIWTGERDIIALTEKLDEQETALVQRVLEIISGIEFGP